MINVFYSGQVLSTEILSLIATIAKNFSLFDKINDSEPQL